MQSLISRILHNRTSLLPAILLFCSASTGIAYAQRLSFGVVAGTGLTDNFPLFEISSPADAFGNPASLFRHQSGSRSLILGATIEAQLGRTFSIEGSFLHRPMRAKVSFREFVPDGSGRMTIEEFTAVRAWEFPVLLKYSFPSPFTRLRPFLAVGPSFRTQEDPQATEPSQIGISVGAGAAYSWRFLRVEPTLRYTRWARESIYPRYATKPDQLELLTTIAFQTAPAQRRLAGRKVEVGAIAGLAATNGFARERDGTLIDERPGYLIGPMVQASLVGNWAVEVDAFFGSARESDKVPILSGFPESDQFGVQRRHPLSLQQQVP